MVQEEIKINTVPDELYNLTQLAEVTLAAGKLSTTNINQIKNYIQQKTICSYDDFSSGVATGGYHDGYFTLPTATSAAPSIGVSTPMSSLYRDDVKKLTDLDEYKINLKSPRAEATATGDSRPNAWIENNFENLFTNYLDTRDTRNSYSNSNPQHSVIKYEKKIKLDTPSSNYDVCNYNSNSNCSNNSLDSTDDFDKKHNLHISSRSPSLSSPISTSSPNFIPSYERERKNFIYSHKIFDRKKSRNLILVEDVADKEASLEISEGGVEWKHNNSDSNDILSKSSSSSSVSSQHHHHHLQQQQHHHHLHGGSVVVDRTLCQLDHSSSGSSIGASDKIVGLQLDESHICPECGKKYSTSSNLARHRQTHRSLQDKKARKCEFCDKVYVSMPAYSMHVRTHNQGCKCSHCGKCFSRPWLLQGHIRTHTGEKPFKCSICPKAFADKSNLRAHIQTHSNTKPHSCVRCGKAFALKSYLYKHEESSCMKNHSRGNTSGGNNTNSDGDTTNNGRSAEYRTKNLLERRIKKSRKMLLLHPGSNNNNNNGELINKYASKSDDINLLCGQNRENTTTATVDETAGTSAKLILKLKENNFLRTSVIRKTVSGKTLNNFNNFSPTYHDVHQHHHHHHHEYHHHHQQQDLVMG